ncbi:MAG: TetR/AcrR family transcriptional regulator [Gammaproteobacteria bacterium]|nr:TetR/AcrR family transcriptional regulator [Gammaproteobacteria bacterium]
MAPGRTDPRSERTRRALLSAFIELVLARGYEAVTVGDIAARAKVGRSTFYLHYAGKEALLRESLRYPCSGLIACVGGDATAQGLTPLLEHFRAQRRINHVFFEHPLRPLWVRSLAALIEHRLAVIGGAPLVPRSLLALLLAETQIALITHWLSATVPVKAESVAQALIVNTRALLGGNLPGIARVGGS